MHQVKGQPVDWTTKVHEHKPTIHLQVHTTFAIKHVAETVNWLHSRVCCLELHHLHVKCQWH